MPPTCLAALLASAFLAFGAVATAHAALVTFVNSPANVSVTGAVARAKYRIYNTNWDMSLDAGGGTVAGNFIE